MECTIFTVRLQISVSIESGDALERSALIKTVKRPTVFQIKIAQVCLSSITKKARLCRLASKSKANLSLPEINHCFVEHRGFAYEFVDCDGVQELSLNDPKYKYVKPGLNIDVNTKVISQELMGSSSCKKGIGSTIQ